MEKVHCRSSSSQAKLSGTIVSITGAFVAFVVKKYPAVVFIVFYVTISAAFTLVAVRDASAWGAKAGCGADFYFICRKRIATLSCFGVERFFIVHKGYS
ncbi:PREDICTED: EUGRSUZ_B02543 [Prunus dulcis]|uniref:PREDICTED: EUGRSUZ_B02543 n=1 Tax=Prunus dulcis TaxID=3755 RepID=A0A5E4FE29_PRUDU|nr:PREDICTED: EUGRSUZ_B02543 [Prunus dulcis]